MSLAPVPSHLLDRAMASMKAMKAKKAMKGSSKGMKSGQALSKGALAQVVADETELKKSEVTKVLNSLAGVAAEQVKKVGKCTIPGVCMVKTRVKPATKAGKRGQGDLLSCPVVPARSAFGSQRGAHVRMTRESLPVGLQGHVGRLSA